MPEIKLTQNTSDDEFMKVYANEAEITEGAMTTTILANRRELNIIVHGIKEDGMQTDQTVRGIFLKRLR